MTNEEAIKRLENIIEKRNEDYRVPLILLDVQAIRLAIEALNNFDKQYDRGYSDGRSDKYHNNEQKPDEWTENGQGFHFCSKCGYFALFQTKDMKNYFEKLSNFCPNCGVRLEKDNE